MILAPPISGLNSTATRETLHATRHTNNDYFCDLTGQSIYEHKHIAAVVSHNEQRERALCFCIKIPRICGIILGSHHYADAIIYRCLIQSTIPIIYIHW